MQKVEDLFVELLRTEGTKFVSFTYRSKGTNELARHTLIVGFVTRHLYERDVVILKDLIDNNKVSGLSLKAAQELLESRIASLTLGVGHNPEYSCAGVYGEVDAGVKVHVIDGSYHVMGLVQNKITLEEGTFKVRNRRPLTIAKDEIRDMLPSEKIRQYKLQNVVGARLNGQTLEIDTVPDVAVLA